MNFAVKGLSQGHKLLSYSNIYSLIKVMAQHYSAVSSSCDVQAVSDSQRSGIVTAAQVQAPAPTVVKASSQQGRRPKGKLAISFAGKPN